MNTWEVIRLLDLSSRPRIAIELVSAVIRTVMSTVLINREEQDSSHDCCTFLETWGTIEILTGLALQLASPMLPWSTARIDGREDWRLSTLGYSRSLETFGTHHEIVARYEFCCHL